MVILAVISNSLHKTGRLIPPVAPLQPWRRHAGRRGRPRSGPEGPCRTHRRQSAEGGRHVEGPTAEANVPFGQKATFLTRPHAVGILQAY
jgi:hypothetical protein